MDVDENEHSNSNWVLGSTASRIPQGATIVGEFSTSTAGTPTRSTIPQGAVIEGVIAEGSSTPIVTDESIVSSAVFHRAPTHTTDTDGSDQKWYFNSSVAITVNAAAHLKDAGGLALECYLTKAFKILTEQVVREDFTAFLEIIAPKKGTTADDLWKKIFKNSRNPGLSTLVKSAAALTELNDYQVHQFTVRPPDLRLAFSSEAVLSIAMCAMMENLSDRVENIETSMSRPSDESICIESAVQSALAPLINSQTRPVLTATRKLGSAPNPISKTAPTVIPTVAVPPKPATAKPAKRFSEILGGSSNQRSRSKTVTGSTGPYVGAKMDKFLKVEVGDSYSSDEVQNAIASATEVQKSEITVEALSHSAKNYSMSYRVKVLAVRADLAGSLLTTATWPAGMKMSEWRGAWRPLRVYDTIKVFVGNVRSDMTAEAVAEKIKQVYEESSVEILTATVFTGKKATPTTHQNFVVEVTAKSKGITMEAVQTAKASGKIPAGIFVRRWGEQPSRTPPSW